MDHSTVYETDILEWSEQQASALRGLAQGRRELSNEIDWEHVAEEIEDVGRSEFFAVQSFVRQILVHLIKAASAPDATTMLHWRKEVVGFHGDMLDRMTPSMRSRLDLAKLWKQALKRADVDLAVHGQSVAPGLPSDCPCDVDTIVSPTFDFATAMQDLSAHTERDADHV